MQLPEAVGPYRPVQLLGRGAFGEVHVASDSRRQGHLVALKIGTRHSLDDEGVAKARDSVLREGALLRRLKHQHIVSCEDVGWDAEQRVVWLALELLDGGSLRDLISSRRTIGTPFHAHFVRRVLLEIGGALQYIHSEDVLHRDVKPANILLTLSAPPVLKLADFGISKLLEGAGMAHSIVGTQYYFSPELASCQPYGAAADAWALGVCLYELAALRRPFDATGGPFALACRIREEPHPPLPTETALDISNAVSGLLEKDPVKRILLVDAMASLDVEEEAIPDTAQDAIEAESNLEVEELLDSRSLQVESMTDSTPILHHAAQPSVPSQAFQPPASAQRKQAFRKEKEPERTGGGRWFSWMPNLFSKSGAADSGRSETAVKEIKSDAGDELDSLDGRC